MLSVNSKHILNINNNEILKFNNSKSLTWQQFKSKINVVCCVVYTKTIRQLALVVYDGDSQLGCGLLTICS